MQLRSPAHRILREATSEMHASVDLIFSLFGLADAHCYAAFLKAQARALLPVELWLDTKAHAVAPDWSQRRRGPALMADLVSLTASVPQGELFAVSDDRASVAGVLYVVEGSRLGSRVLAKRVPPALPRAYLAATPPPGHWPSLLSKLDDVVIDRASRTAAIEAALSVFARFERAGLEELKGISA
jgi:heme oxygenase (biliverdin-IX-beta and delta-forming)